MQPTPCLRLAAVPKAAGFLAACVAERTVAGLGILLIPGDATPPTNHALYPVLEGLMPDGVRVMRTEIGTTAAAKPLLRGYSHAVAAILAVLGTVKLLRLTAGDPPKQLTMLI